MRPPAPARTPFNWAEWLLLGALALWMLVAVPMTIWGWPAISGVLVHQATTAWVQTIGVLIGIGVAIWVPWNQRRRTLFDATLSAASLATYVVAIVQSACKKRVWTTPEATKKLLMHLQVAARLWATVRLDALPIGSVPSFVGLIALTDEAIDHCQREVNGPGRDDILFDVWSDTAARAANFRNDIRMYTREEGGRRC